MSRLDKMDLVLDAITCMQESGVQVTVERVREQVQLTTGLQLTLQEVGSVFGYLVMETRGWWHRMVMAG